MSKQLNISEKLLQTIFYKEAKTLHLSKFNNHNVIINDNGPEKYREVVCIDKCLNKFRRFANQEGFVLDGSVGFSEYLLLQPTIDACEEIYSKKYIDLHK